MTRHERRHPFLAECAGGLWRRVAVEELEGDRRVDVGEDLGGSRPELLEQTAELVGRGDPLTDHVVAHTDQAAQRLGLVGQRRQRAEAMPVRAQQVRQQVRVAEVRLALRRGVPWARRLDGVGMDGHHREPLLDERVDDEAGGPLDRHAQLGCWCELGQASDEVLHPTGGVCRGEPSDDRTTLVDHAHGVFARGPVQANEKRHGYFLAGTTTADARGTCRTLINWRSTAFEPGRNILLSVKVPRSLRGGGSHCGRRAASGQGRPRRGAGGSEDHPLRLGSRGQLFGAHDRRVH